MIYRDTLERDFGHDRDLLAKQVEITLRHELAHHLGWDEDRGGGTRPLTGAAGGGPAPVGGRSIQIIATEASIVATNSARLRNSMCSAEPKTAVENSAAPRTIQAGRAIRVVPAVRTTPQVRPSRACTGG